jgi:hypothetical protein
MTFPFTSPRNRRWLVPSCRCSTNPCASNMSMTALPVHFRRGTACHSPRNNYHSRCWRPSSAARTAKLRALHASEMEPADSLIAWLFPDLPSLRLPDRILPSCSAGLARRGMTLREQQDRNQRISPPSSCHGHRRSRAVSGSLQLSLQLDCEVEISCFTAPPSIVCLAQALMER